VLLGWFTSASVRIKSQNYADRLTGTAEAVVRIKEEKRQNQEIHKRKKAPSRLRRNRGSIKVCAGRLVEAEYARWLTLASRNRPLRVGSASRPRVNIEARFLHPVTVP